jgi:hypothetical protein
MNYWNSSVAGNYWSNYLSKYPNASEIGNSGIWNTAYEVDANNSDYYPLMSPIDILTGEITKSTPTPTPSPDPTPTLTPSPTPEPTPEPTQTPIPTLEPENSINTFLVFGTIIVIAVAAAGALVYFKRKGAKRE